MLGPVSLEWRIAVADFRLCLAQRRFGRALDDLVRKYRPDQPRVPKGTPDIGGEWTIDPGSARQRRLAAERVRVAQAGGSIDLYSVNLLAEEFKGPPGNQGHSVERHVGKSGEELVALLADTRRVVAQTPTELTYRAKKAWGSFPTISEANELVSQALLANQTQVDRVRAGLSNQEVIRYDFGYPTGIEAYWVSVDPPPATRPTFSVTVVIRPDPYSLRGYRVHTAFPMNRDPRLEIVQ